MSQPTPSSPSPQRPPAVRAARASSAPGMVPSAPRKARLVLSRIEPWSALKVGFLFSISVSIVALVAVSLLWLLFDIAGVFDAVGRSVRDITGSSVDPTTYFGFGRVILVTFVISAIQVVLTTALATLAATLYNVVATSVGGLEVVLAEDD